VIDRDIYFENVRNELFSGAMSQQQVDGQCVLLGLWDYQATGSPMEDLRWLAYILATVYHECATKMWPITEYGDDDYLQSSPGRRIIETHRLRWVLLMIVILSITLTWLLIAS
jgi:hypothetical protein